MANAMNKSAAVITGTGANSIIRGAKTMLSGHYSHKPLRVKICVQTGGSITPNLFRERRVVKGSLW